MTDKFEHAPIVVAALYKFVSLPDYKELREQLLEHMKSFQINGLLLCAEEGINGTICGTRTGMDLFLNWLKQDERFSNLEHKESYTDERPFQKTKVKLKREIITMGVEGVNPNEKVGKYVEAEQWNELISDPEVLLIDTRNDYEVSFGTFEKAINPNTKCFSEFPQYVKQNVDPTKHKKIVSFIRIYYLQLRLCFVQAVFVVKKPLVTC
jgi:UPF0176 protein